MGAHSDILRSADQPRPRCRPGPPGHRLRLSTRSPPQRRALLDRSGPIDFGGHLLDHADLLTQARTVRTRPEDPMRYGFGWAIGPSGQMYLNGRLPGYRTALMLVPDHNLVGVTLAADSNALPAEARILSELQRDLTGDDLAEAIDAFAA